MMYILRYIYFSGFFFSVSFFSFFFFFFFFARASSLVNDFNYRSKILTAKIIEQESIINYVHNFRKFIAVILNYCPIILMV